MLRGAWSNSLALCSLLFQSTMNEEQFVNIDLDDDNVCSVCKLGTEKETLSFCHICFELNIEGTVLEGLLLCHCLGVWSWVQVELVEKLPQSFGKLCARSFLADQIRFLPGNSRFLRLSKITLTKM